VGTAETRRPTESCKYARHASSVVKFASNSVRLRGYSSTIPTHYILGLPESSGYPPSTIRVYMGTLLSVGNKVNVTVAVRDARVYPRGMSKTYACSFSGSSAQEWCEWCNDSRVIGLEFLDPSTYHRLPPPAS
jgi:hypothetical protein